MCIVCTDWLKGKMTNKEALNAIGEMFETSTEEESKHYFEVVEKILDKEVPFNEGTD